MSLIREQAIAASREDLANVITPGAMGTRHQPVPHAALVSQVTDAMKSRGLAISREQFSLGGVDQENLFAMFDVDASPKAGLPGLEGQSFAMGLRSSNVQKFSIGIVAGLSICVCDNLVFDGDLMVLARKHTVGLDLEFTIEQAIDRYIVRSTDVVGQTTAMKERTLTTMAAKAKMVDVFVAGALPNRLFGQVAGNYLNPDAAWTDCTPRTEWGLFNAFTRAARDLKPEPMFNATLALGRQFGLTGSDGAAN